MKRNNLLAAAGVAAIIAVIAAISVSNRQSVLEGSVEDNTAELITQAQRDRLEETQTILVETNEETITLRREENDRWVVEENAGYLADEERVARILRGFALMKPVEPKTANPELFGRLGVRDPEEEGSEGVRVTLQDGGGETIISAIVGSRRPRAGDPQVYLRVPDVENAWLVESPIEARGDLRAYTRSEVMNISATEFTEFESERWDGLVTQLDRPTSGTAEWNMTNVPGGKQVISAGRLRSFLTPFQNLRHDGLVEVAQWDGLTSESLVRAQTWDGLAVEATVRADEEGKRYARFVVSAEEEAQEERAAEIAEAAEGYVFRLTDWAANNWLKDHDEFLEDIPEQSAQAAHILVAWEGSEGGIDKARSREEARAKAERLLAELENDPDLFDTFAREESDAANAGVSGGVLGEVSTGTMDEAFEEALFALESGEISGVVETPQGFHIIKRTD